MRIHMTVARSCSSSLRIGADSLTLAALKVRFLQVPLEQRDSMMRTRQSGLNLARVRGGHSSICGAGRGLFATRHIEADELVTLYPCDALFCYTAAHPQRATPHLSSGAAATGLHGLVDGAEIDMAECPEDARRYMVRISASRAIVGDPAAVNDAAYLGHLANDGAACHGAGSAMEVYETASEAAANVVLKVGAMHDCSVAVVAIKPIDSGCEVLLSWRPRVNIGGSEASGARGVTEPAGSEAASSPTASLPWTARERPRVMSLQPQVRRKILAIQARRAALFAHVCGRRRLLRPSRRRRR